MEYDTVTSDKAYELAISMEAAEVNAVLVDDCSRVRNGDSVPVSSTTSVHLVGESKTRGDSSVEHWRLGHARDTVCFSGRSWWRRSRGQQINNYPVSDCKVCGDKHKSETCKLSQYSSPSWLLFPHLKRMCPRLQL